MTLSAAIQYNPDRSWSHPTDAESDTAKQNVVNAGGYDNFITA